MQRNNDAWKELMELDSEFDKVTSVEGIEGWVSFFAEDGVMVPSHGDVIKGQDCIRQAMGGAFATQDFSLRWKPMDAEVSDDETLGYTYGEYWRSYKTADGKVIEQTGRYTSVWRKQNDGSWKIILDIGN